MSDGLPGRMLAFVRNTGVNLLEGWVLYWEPPFEGEVSDSRYLEDHDFPQTPEHGEGLFLFEGYVHVTPGPEPDVEFEGAWRRLTHWEMLQVQAGFPPWSRA